MARNADSEGLVWEEVASTRNEGGMMRLRWNVHRAKVPGGWLVVVIHNTSGLAFYPDPQHTWDGRSLP